MAIVIVVKKQTACQQNKQLEKSGSRYRKKSGQQNQYSDNFHLQFSNIRLIRVQIILRLSEQNKRFDVELSQRFSPLTRVPPNSC